MARPMSYNAAHIAHMRNINPEVDALLHMLEEQDHKNSRQSWISNLIFLILGWLLGQISLSAIAHSALLLFIH
jgi:preprotein translocase subunit Sec63